MQNIIITCILSISSFVVNAQYCSSFASDPADSKCDLVQLIGDNQDINNNTSSNGCETYSDYTSMSADLSIGQTYTVIVMQGTCGGDYDRYCNAWIDFNNDGDFNDTGEALGNGSSTSSSSGFAHSFNFSVPGNATTGSTRMRVIVQEGGTANDPCATYTWGETEDYSVLLVQSNVPPVAEFEMSFVPCDSVVSFNDISSNDPTSWNWDFGDGNSSSQQNPTHTFSGNGNYVVSLTVTNAFGSNSTSQTVSINTGGVAPIGATCEPQTLSPSNGFGINQVIFNTINNSSGDGTNGYEDFAQCDSTAVYAGSSYPIYINTDTPQPHNVKAWIDYNNDGSFSNSSELILSKSATLITEDTITIPSAVVMNTPLRLRVAADWYLQPAPDGCSDVQNGQVEDYTIYIIENTNPPAANFDSDFTLSCDGNIQFTDQSNNVPTSWEWNFGDGTTSAQQNPTHHYDTSGVYDVTLIVTNNYGSDTLEFIEFIEIDYSNSISPASCTPNTTSNCCGYGIFRVNFADINNSTGDGSESYQDYSCSKNTEVDMGGCYTIEVRTGTDNEEDVKVWIDFNNDSNFTDATELVFESYNAFVHTAVINIPSAGIVTGTPLRMRVASEATGNSFNSCGNSLGLLQFGQVEDYAVTINNTTVLPFVFFSADETISCDGTISFNDESCGGGFAWLWNFGDGTASSQQNPTHTYNAPGTYDVSLVVTNSNGTGTDTLYDYITITSLFGQPVAPVCEPQTFSPFEDMGIHHVVFNTINKWSPSDNGYQDYSCTNQTALDVGFSYSVLVQTGATYEEDVNIWIDFNDNGDLSFNELVFQSQFQIQTHSGSINIPTSGVSFGVPLRMRVMSDYSQGFMNSCTDPDYGQVEDYAVIIADPASAPIANFTVDSTILCMGIVNFTNLSSASATVFNWNFGDGQTSAVENPVHYYASPGTYTVTLIATNGNGSDTITFIDYIEYVSDCADVGIESPIMSSINIFPNPTNGTVQFVFENNASAPISIELFDVYGKLIDQEMVFNNNTTIDLTNRPTGVYLAKVTYKEEVKVVKIIRK